MDIEERYRKEGEEGLLEYLNEGYDIESDPEVILYIAVHYNLEKLVEQCLEIQILPPP